MLIIHIKAYFQTFLYHIQYNREKTVLCQSTCPEARPCYRCFCIDRPWKWTNKEVWLDLYMKIVLTIYLLQYNNEDTSSFLSLYSHLWAFHSPPPTPQPYLLYFFNILNSFLCLSFLPLCIYLLTLVMYFCLTHFMILYRYLSYPPYR